MEVPARQAAGHGLTASAILEVAEGLRWSDPQLSFALAEHVIRAAGDDPGSRAAAERSAVLALGQLGRAAEVVVRALPHLREAERAGHAVDAAMLRCEIAIAAVQCGDADAAAALLEPLAAGPALPAGVRAEALGAWAAARAERGDVPGVDAAARQAADLAGGTETGEATAVEEVRRVAVQRARARARRVVGDTSEAAAILLALGPMTTAADGGRQAALLGADLVEVLGELGRVVEAREVGTPLLRTPPTAPTAPALGRVRCALARAVHLPAGDVDTAERLAREVVEDLAGRDHPAKLADALEVLAEVAERRGDAAGVGQQLRRAQGHATSAHEDVVRALVALAAALARADDRLPPAPGGSDAAAAPSADTEPSTGRTSTPVPAAAPEEPAAREPAPDAAVPSPTDDPAPVPAGDTLPSPGGTGAGLALWEELERGADDDAVPSIGLALAREAAEPQPAPVREARRRRRHARHRDDPEPGDLLASALAARAGRGVDTPVAPLGASEERWPGLDDDGSSFDLGSGAAAEPAAAADTSADAPRADTVPPADRGPDGTGDPSDVAAATHSRRLARARARWEATDSSLLSRRAERARATAGVRPSPVGADGRNNGAGTRADGQDHRPTIAGDGNGTDIRGHTGDRGPGRENGHGARRDGMDGLVARDPDPETLAVRPQERDRPREEVRPAAPGGADDELAQELALTLVDLLAEYQDPSVPLGGPGGATPARSADGGSRPGPRRPSGSAGLGSAVRGRPPHSERSGVPTARRPDVGGPRLADLLADAMDVYHRSGSGQTPADDRGAHR